MLPKIGNYAVERAGVRLVGEIVEEEFGWIFREQLICDTGIDAQIEIVDDGDATGQLIAMQIKTGNSYFENSSKEGVVFYGELRHLEYWSNHSLPVLLILCDIEERKCYWQHVTPESIEKTEKAWKIFVPSHQLFTINAKKTLRKIAITGRFLQGNPPSWATGKKGLDCWYFKNLFFEQWVAKIEGDILLFSGVDIDWHEIRLNVEQAESERKRIRNILNPTFSFSIVEIIQFLDENRYPLAGYIFSDEELFWIASVLKVAVPQMQWKIHATAGKKQI